jgi:alpha-D-ribose 1-methylphosphonate 5-triphosphate synthase subunit PhnG
MRCRKTVTETGSNRRNRRRIAAMTNSRITPHDDVPADESLAARPRWSAVLALASLDELERAWAALAEKPEYRLLRPTATGLALVRGRIGGTGRPFNLGEMTMTRAAVQVSLSTGNAVIGFGHIAGRQGRRAELVAVFDAMLQMAHRHDTIERDVVTPLAARQRAARATALAKVAATKVDVFTVVRGA